METTIQGLLSFIPDWSWQLWLLVLGVWWLTTAALFYAIVFIAAPVPRAPRSSEQTYHTADSDGKVLSAQKLPCWHDEYLARNTLSRSRQPSETHQTAEPADIFMSLVVPAYNEEARLNAMLDEACAFLDSEYGYSTKTMAQSDGASKMKVKRRKHTNGSATARSTPTAAVGTTGWEVLIVSDGSTDKTEDVALSYARKYPGHRVRVITLERNRGKGGATTHGLRHVRGAYAVFADADGASRFPDLRALVAAADKVADAQERAVAIGSRAHMVGTPAVVQRSAVRNFLMYSFHLLLWTLTPKQTSKIRDTQCGFKLFTRESLPYIVPHMHSEGWIFDVEMLMLAEAAGIPMVEVPIGWKEVKGSKLNIVWDSLGMAWGLAVLRAAWAIGVYKV